MFERISSATAIAVKSVNLCGACTAIVVQCLLLGCAPTIALQAPSEPIEINMNIKIEHEIRIKVDKELETMLDDDELF